MKDDDALARHAGDRLTAINEASTAAARELNGALTALLLYMGEIRQHSPALAHSNSDKRYLQTIVENALQQTERLCALVEQIAATRKPANNAAKRGGEVRSDHPRRDRGLPATPVAVADADAGAKPTRREREVLTLIVEGCTNKQGAQKMKISPRTFESHRAEVMRKLGARNTAELVRAALPLLSTDQ
jgi:DNA-binding NarL/FixJ family response regulator